MALESNSNGKADKERVPRPVLEEGAKRLIVATCEKGTVEDKDSMLSIKKGLMEIKKKYPNLVEKQSEEVWQAVNPPIVADSLPKMALTAKQKGRITLMNARSDFRIGIPRVLNQYSVNPFFSAYFESLGIPAKNLIYSDFTTEELYKEGAKRGAIDPCFPSKIAISHIHNILFKKHTKNPLNVIFFPMIDTMGTYLSYVQDTRACPTVNITPEAVWAAFTKEGNLFEEYKVDYLKTFLNFAEPLLVEKQMFEAFESYLGLSKAENGRAVEEGYRALNNFHSRFRQEARELINNLEKENRLGIVVLARPYHNDPGLNHGILEELQKQGYPIIPQEALPHDSDLLERLFGKEIENGDFRDAFDINDVWKNSYSENTSRKVWAAKYVARHPNLVALELSSFKCGHDAPIYSTIEDIIEFSGTPYFSFKDIDENKPSGSIKIRVETIAYFLKRYREDHLLSENFEDELVEQVS